MNAVDYFKERGKPISFTETYRNLGYWNTYIWSLEKFEDYLLSCIKKETNDIYYTKGAHMWDMWDKATKTNISKCIDYIFGRVMAPAHTAIQEQWALAMPFNTINIQSKNMVRLQHQTKVLQYQILQIKYCITTGACPHYNISIVGKWQPHLNKKYSI